MSDMLVAFISATGAFLLLTPLAVLWLIWSQNKATRKVAEQVERARQHTAEVAEQAAKKVAETLLVQTRADKREMDEKLEVIRRDVNSNLTAALNEIDDLKSRLGITKENPRGTR